MEAALKYEVDRFQALPHTVVYVEGGYSDSNSVGYTVNALDAIGVNKIRGFFTNDTHNQWTSDEIRWATRSPSAPTAPTSSSTPPATAAGPKLNPHPTIQGVEDLCSRARPRPRPRAQHRPRVPVRGRADVDAPARKLERPAAVALLAACSFPHTPSAWPSAPTSSWVPGSSAVPTELAAHLERRNTGDAVLRPPAATRCHRVRAAESTSAAIRRAASGCASVSEARPIAASRPGSPSSIPTSCASRVLVSSPSAMTTAAPSRSM